MKRFGSSTRYAYLLLPVLFSCMLALMSCDSSPGENQAMFGITSDEPVGTYEDLRRQLELAGLTYMGTVDNKFYQKNYPGSAVHMFETGAKNSGMIIIGPEGHVIDTSVSCYHESEPCLSYLDDLMTAHGFDLQFTRRAREEYASNNLKSWYKWQKSRKVAGRIDKDPQALRLVLMDRKHSKK